MTSQDMENLARRFLSVLGHRDAEVVKSVAVDDVAWIFPGKSPISGEAHGVEGMRTIASYGVKVEVIRAVFGFSGAAMILHNTGTSKGKVLDEHLAAVFAFRGDRIARLDTYLSDVPMMETFFA